MKLTKKKIITLTKSGFEQQGYVYFKDSTTGAQGLFVRKLDNAFYLTVGLTISRYYNTMFTGTLYLSKVTMWSSIWGDIPVNSYERIGAFLTSDERLCFLPNNYQAEGMKDAWWDAGTESGIDSFFKSLQRAEPRFLTQDDLYENINKSIEVTALSQSAIKVIQRMSKQEIYNIDHKFIPSSAIDDIPIEWFKVAEEVLAEDKNAILNKNTVTRLAADSYRQKIVSELSL